MEIAQKNMNNNWIVIIALILSIVVLSIFTSHAQSLSVKCKTYVEKGGLTVTEPSAEIQKYSNAVFYSYLFGGEVALDSALNDKQSKNHYTHMRLYIHDSPSEMVEAIKTEALNKFNYSDVTKANVICLHNAEHYGIMIYMLP